MDERELVAAAKCGDEGAFTALYRLFERQVETEIGRIARSWRTEDGNPQLTTVVEDIKQDTFTQAWLSLDNFNGECQLLTWLVTIARNLCFAYIRKAKRRDTAHQGYVRFREHCAGADPTESLVQQVLENVPAGEARQLVEMRLDGLSNHDIRRATGMCDSRVRSSIQRAYRIAREKLGVEASA